MGVLDRIVPWVLLIVITVIIKAVNLTCNIVEWLTGWRAWDISEQAVMSRLTVEQKKFLLADKLVYNNFRNLITTLRQSHIQPCGRADCLYALVLHATNRPYYQSKLNNNPYTQSCWQMSRPIFIIGSMRSGTTLLHNLLNCDSKLYCQTLEQMWPKESKSKRSFCSVLSSVRTFIKLRHIHSVRMDTPEDIFALLSLFYLDTSANNGCFGNDLSANWMASLDQSTYIYFYEHLKKYLQYLWSKHSPISQMIVINLHLRMTQLWALSEVFPDAIFIHTVRDCTTTVGSCCSLTRVISSTWLEPSSALDAAIGQITLNGLSAKSQQYLDFRRAKEDRHTFIDVRYTDLLSDPVGEVDRIYKTIGMELSSETRTKMGDYLKENKQHKHGKHTYSLTEFGLSVNQVSEAFREYNDFYKL